MRLEKPLPPGSVVGILGGGQLGRMLALAAARLGLKCHIYAPEGDNPAFDVAFARTEAAYDDRQALESFAAAVDVITYEFENVPAETAAFLGERVPLAPGAEILAISQDRLTEKSFLSELGVGVAAFAAIDDEFSLEWALNKIGRPAILKTRRLGYDGKGQVRIAEGDDPGSAWTKSGGAPSIIERSIDFEREISVIAARSWDGTFVVYDIPENEHENHILRRSSVPARIAEKDVNAAQAIASTITTKLDYVGVIGIEMFVTGAGVLVNEIAPRVHNSGHWTIDACAVSQFEQHVRAIAGWPLGDPYRHSDVVMTNLLANEADDWVSLASKPLTAVHIYGKTEARPGRKMGHVNRLTPRQA
jgi:5-(carboxyamino)imidazole ribonucleotide synthase